MQNSMMLFIFSFSTGNTFWGNLVQKIEIVSLQWNLIPRLIRTFRIQWWRSLFLFIPEILFLRKFGPKNEDWQFKLKFGTQNNSNMQYSMTMLTLSVLDWKCSFGGNLVQKVKIVSLSWILVSNLIRILQNSMMLFTFSIFNQKYPFCANMVEKLKVSSLSWSLIPRLIRLSSAHIFRFWPEITFLSIFGPKYQNCLFKMKLDIILIRIHRIQWWCSLFLF